MNSRKYSISTEMTKIAAQKQKTNSRSCQNAVSFFSWMALKKSRLKNDRRTLMATCTWFSTTRKTTSPVPTLRSDSIREPKGPSGMVRTRSVSKNGSAMSVIWRITGMKEMR